MVNDNYITLFAALSVKLYPRLLIVPVDTLVLLTCEIQYNGSYSVQWYRLTESGPIRIYHDPSKANNSTLHFNITVGSEYKNTHILCVIHPTDGGPNDTRRSNYATLNAISEGNHNLI